jgi:hypothetical protein
VKIFESAINELKLDSTDEQSNHLFVGNNDLACLIVNYIKCLAIQNGCCNEADYFKENDKNKKLFSYLQKVNPSVYNEFFEERKSAEMMFNEALKQIL